MLVSLVQFGWADEAQRRAVRAQVLELLRTNRIRSLTLRANLENRHEPGFKESNPFTSRLVFTQGEICKSPVPTDLAVNGQGWFGLRNGRELLLSRNGRFHFRDGLLLDERGAVVEGFGLDPSGQIYSEAGSISLPLDPATQLYCGLYTGFHFDESGKLYGENVLTDPVTGQRVTARTPLFQLALYTVADPAGLQPAYGPCCFRTTIRSGKPVQGVAGQGALGQICPGALEMASVDEEQMGRERKALEQFEDVLTQPGWVEVEHSSPQDVRRELCRRMASESAFCKACLENLRNRFTAGFRPNRLLEGALRRDFSQGVLQQTNSPYDLALQGAGFFVLSDGSLTRNGALAYSAQSHTLTAGGLSVMGYRRAGKGFASTPEPVALPVDATYVEFNGDGVMSWTRMGDDRQEIGFRLAVVQPVGNLRGDGNRFRGKFRYGVAGEDGLGQIAQGHLEMPAVEPYEERLVISSLLAYTGLPVPVR